MHEALGSVQPARAVRRRRGQERGEGGGLRGTDHESQRRQPADDPHPQRVPVAADLRSRRQEAGRGDAGVAQVAGDAPAPLPAHPIQFEAEQAEGDLGLAVGAGAVVGPLPVQVVPVDGPLIGGDADLRRDAGPPRAEQRQQVRDQRDMAEVVGPELELEAVGGRLPGGRGHHAGVVDEQVDGAAVVEQRAAERRHGCEGRQVEGVRGDGRRRRRGADRGDRRLGLRGVPRGQDDVRARRGEAARDAEADAVGAAGHDGALAGEIGKGEVDRCSVHGCQPRSAAEAHPGTADPRMRAPSGRRDRSGPSTVVGRRCG